MTDRIDCPRSAADSAVTCRCAQAEAHPATGVGTADRSAPTGEGVPQTAGAIRGEIGPLQEGDDRRALVVRGGTRRSRPAPSSAHQPAAGGDNPARSPRCRARHGSDRHHRDRAARALLNAERDQRGERAGGSPARTAHRLTQPPLLDPGTDVPRAGVGAVADAARLVVGQSTGAVPGHLAVGPEAAREPVMDLIGLWGGIAPVAPTGEEAPRAGRRAPRTAR